MIHIATASREVRQISCNLGYNRPGVITRTTGGFCVENAMPWEKKTEQVRVALTPSDVALIDAWAARKRLGSRAEALRQLIFKGLLSEGALPDAEE